MTERAAENSSPSEKPSVTFDPMKPWPWVSYEDEAWTYSPWDLADYSDLAETAVRFAIWATELHLPNNSSVLDAAALIERATAQVIADVVAESRTKRFSWGRIGQAFGVTRTAAQKRFGKAPSVDRARTLEDQYQRLKDFVRFADPESHDNQEELEAARDAWDACRRRRRGFHDDPLDSLPKVVRRRRRQS